MVWKRDYLQNMHFMASIVLGYVVWDTIIKKIQTNEYQNMFENKFWEPIDIRIIFSRYVFKQAVNPRASFIFSKLLNKFEKLDG